MSASDTGFSGSIPEFYDRYLVPLIFTQYAEDMAARVAAMHPSAVLEIAAGTGVVTRALAARLSPDARYVASDLNQPMLDHAASQQGADDRIEWRQADALALPFADASFDVVCCQFGAMFFPDRVKGYAEARRVLKSGGNYIFNVWDRIEDNVFANEVTTALSQMFPQDPPRFLARTPHGYNDEAQITRELNEASFARVTIEKKSDVSRAPSARQVALAFCQGTPLRTEIEARLPGGLEAATAHAAGAIEQAHGTGEVAAKIQALVITARV